MIDRQRTLQRVARPLLALLALAVFGALPATAGDLPPVVPPPEPVALPTPLVRTLPNGLRVLVVERHSLPVVTLRLVVRAGAEKDPPDLPGTAQFVASMLDEGTTRRSALDVAEAIDSAGGSFDSGVDWDSTFGELSVLSDHTPLAFDLLADLVLHPAFAPSAVERVRRQTLSALDVLHQDPGYVADAVFDRLVFEGTPYGHPLDGTLGAVKRLTPEDLARFHAREYQPGRTLLAVVGDVEPEAAFREAVEYFGGWNGRAESAAGPPASVEATHVGRQVAIVNKPDAVQTEIRLGNLGIPRASPDYLALTVANQILGGPASNRLFSDLRGEHGLTYSASSDLDCRALAGSWEAKTSTRTPETAQAVRRALDEIKHMQEQSISQPELQMAVNYLIGHQALDFETSAGIADQFLDLMTYDLSLDTWSRLPLALRELSPEDVWNATRRHLDADRAVIVLVGNAAEFAKDLRKLGPTRVIPIDSLDLGSADLERLPAPAGGSGSRSR
jgi:zinc protease